MAAGMPRCESLLATLVAFQIASFFGLAARADEPGKSFALTVVSAENDAPLTGAEVEFRLYGETRTNATVAVDETGVARFDYPADAAKGRLYFTVRKPGFVAYGVDVDEAPRERFLTEKTVRLERGDKVGGIVLDDQGKPLAGANVRMTVPMTETARTHYHMVLLDTTTGEDGRWVLDGAPKPVESLSISVSHPEFLPDGFALKPGTDAKYSMKRGWAIRGVVKTSEGEPVEGARVHPGGDIWGSPYASATTDANGKFALHGLPRQRTHVTVSPQRHSPARQTIDPEGEADAEIKFVVEPAKVLRLRVVDAKGQPVADAGVSADTWRGMRNVDWRTKTDANGEVAWEGAPSDAVIYDIVASGFIAKRDQSLVARDEPYILELSPVVKALGKVAAADTGEPIKGFKVTPGRRYPGQADRTLWDTLSAVPGRDGRFELTIDEQMAELFLKIEADGYAPYLSSAIAIAAEVRPLDVRLEPAKPGTPGAAPEGIVLAPDGTPAADAAITLGLESHNFQYLHGYRPTEPAQSAVTNADGRFALKPLADPKEAGIVAVVHDSGYAEVQLSELAEGKPIRLEAWARLEVVAKRGSQPFAGAGIAVQPEWRREQQVKVFSYGIRDKTNDEGVVVFDRVVPRRSSVGLELRQPSARGETVYSERWQRVDFRPGETSRVELGGAGRAIIGKVELPPNPPAAHDWIMNEGGEIVTAGKQHDDPDYRSYRFLFAKDGSFRIEDIPPGDYSLNVRLTAAPDGSQCGTGNRIGDAKLDSFIHDDSSLAANDLGSVAGSWIERIGVGSPAPFFVARTAQGGVTTLDDYRGKLTLIDFWATWCGPCLADMPRLAELHEKYRGDESFALIAVALDEDFESAKAVAANGDWKWTVVDGGAGTQSLFARCFDILAIPDKILVGPDGVILYRGNDLAMVDVVIAEALENFPASTEANPASTPGASVVDDFQPSSKQASFVAAFAEPYVAPEGPKDHQAKGGLFLYAADGTLIRQVTDLTPDGWLKRADRLAVDRKRGRVYAIEYDRVLALDRDGRMRFDVALDGVQAVAVDEKTGDLWCLCLSNLASGWTIVLGEDGQRKAAHPSYGFTLRFSPQHDAFWIVGESARLVARDGSVLAEHSLDGKAYTFGALAVDAKGDCWALEDSHPDVPGSGERVWRISREKAGIVDEGFAYNYQTKRGTMTNWVEAVGDEVWVGWSSIDDEKTRTRKVRRFALDGAVVGELERDVQAAAGIGDALWAYSDGDFAKLDAAGAETARVEHGEPIPEGVYQSVWVVAFE